MTERRISGPLVGWKTCDGCGDLTTAKPTYHPSRPNMALILCKKCKGKLMKPEAPQK